MSYKFIWVSSLGSFISNKNMLKKKQHPSFKPVPAEMTSAAS